MTPEPGGLASLYPFLYEKETAGGVDLVAEVEASTVEKARDVLELRDAVVRERAPLLRACAAAMADRFAAGGRLFTFGNGGSATDAHAVARLFLCPPSGAALPASSLAADTAILTALANDVGFEVVFARQVAALARPADVALGLSTSGGSANVLRAFEEAHRRHLLTVGFAGYDGGRMAESDAIDFLFVVPSSSVHRIQEAQTTLYQVLWSLTQSAREANTGRITVG